MIPHSTLPAEPVICSSAENMYPSIVKVIVSKPALLTAVLTHEIRNPVNCINLAVEMLKPLITSDSEKEYLDIIIRATAKINNLVNELIVQQRQQQRKQEQVKDKSM